MLGRIHSTESCGTVDGPGIRFIVFMQGCLMRCQYCHNRDSWALDDGKLVSVDELMEQILSYRHFFEASGGGITASGGEAILQVEFLVELFKRVKAEGLHTCLDTNGFARHYTPALDELLSLTDLVLLDIKQMDDDKHIALTQVSNKRTLQFAEYLAKLNQPTWIRYVVVDGFTDDVDSAEALAEFIAPMKNVEQVELLPYHELGKHKWQALGLDYPLDGVKPPSGDTMKRILGVFEAKGLKARY
ncbi:pyruvate formate lyase 1-activating protein [Paraferrimonas sedimenticola]|uniref:Pyruvate formate-lyase-activating enzyme n=1 Tax=Paraferrimonas sedimenticola TaxID=375674 RepID=A0AA37RP82_9GAMM|nr:pyruvate formate lyase 1-activating protein [Paraferrimonas sedimenticola]GLP94808.1 pyruvate formate-lyase-activating enzyme [Paraferrimonas sedimenticola]